MSAANIKAGIEISAEVKGEEVVAKLAKTIEEAGIDTAALTERGKELSQTFARLDKAAALAEQFKKLKTQTQEVAAELSRAQAQTASLAREMKANPSKELEKQFKAAAAEAGRLKQRKAELAVETHNTRKALAEAGISTKKLAQEERRLAAESEKARQDLAALNEEAQKLKRLADAKIALGLHVDVQANKEMQRLNRSYAELKQNGSLTKRELKAATAAFERELRRLSQTMDGIPSKQTAISSSVAGMGRTMLAAAGVGGGIYAVNEGLRRIIDTTTEFAAIKSRMEYAFSGADGAAEQMEWVKGVAAELGLELKSAANGYAQLAAATKNINMSTEATQQVFKGVASAAASMNLSTEETNGVLLALSQIAGKGKVSMEELRGQLGERLTPAMAIAAKSMGVTTAELEKMVENGIAAEDFLPKFGAAMEEAFGGTESASASVNRLKNRLDELMLKFGEAGGISDAYNAVLSDVGAGLDKLEAAMDGLDGALTGSLSDAFVSAYDTAKTGAAEVAHLIETVIGYINEAGNALTGRRRGHRQTRCRAPVQIARAKRRSAAEAAADAGRSTGSAGDSGSRTGRAERQRRSSARIGSAAQNRSVEKESRRSIGRGRGGGIPQIGRIAGADLPPPARKARSRAAGKTTRGAETRLGSPVRAESGYPRRCDRRIDERFEPRAGKTRRERS